MQERKSVDLENHPLPAPALAAARQAAFLQSICDDSPLRWSSLILHGLEKAAMAHFKKMRCFYVFRKEARKCLKTESSFQVLKVSGIDDQRHFLL